MVNGDERPAPPKAKFGYMTKENMPDFTMSKKNHVTCMQFSIQSEGGERSLIEGIGPVRVPLKLKGGHLASSELTPKYYLYTGFVEDNSETRHAVPHGKGEFICGDFWAKGEFKMGAIWGVGVAGSISTGEQWSGTFLNGKFHGEMSKYSNNGSLIATIKYAHDVRDGDANEYIGVGAQQIHGIGLYTSGERFGLWKMTEADGKHYTTWFGKGGREVMEKRTAAVYLKPLPPPTELDADGNPKVYTVDEMVQLAKEDDKTLASAPPKSQNPRERTFVNALSHELQEAGIVVTHEHKAGPGREAVDFKFSHSGFDVLCAAKIHGSELSQNSGDLLVYRHWLSENDPEITRLAKEDKLIACHVLATEPKQHAVKAVKEVADQYVWTPSKGKLLDYIKGIIAEKKKAAVAA